MGSYNILFIVIMLVVFYLLLILPQRRQQKQRQQMMSRLGTGAKIVTTSGIYGEIIRTEDDKMVVRVAPSVELEMDARAVMRVVEAPQQAVQAEADGQ